MILTLRDYQEDAVTAVFGSWERGLPRVAMVLPTGGGKTVTFAEVLSRVQLERDPARPMMVLAHRTELIEQAASTIRRLVPSLRVGIVKGTVRQTRGDVIVASQQSLRTRAAVDRIPALSLVIVDECHRVPSPTYTRTLDMLGVPTAKAVPAERYPADGPRLLGVTATFTREDKRSMGDHFDDVAYRLDVVDLIERGHLVDVRFKRVLVEGLDLSKVNTSTGTAGRDLEPGSLAQVMHDAGAFGVVAESYRRHASDRQGIVFTPTVASAHEVADALRARGITAAAVSGDTPPGARRGTLAAFRTGAVQVLVNANIFTEGTDLPMASCVVLARPTYSGTLFRQMVGRAIRPFPRQLEERVPGRRVGAYPEKRDALVLDLTGSTGRNELRGPEDLVDHDVRDWSEGETLIGATRRRAAARADEALNAETVVTGSLAAVDLDPWSELRRAGLVTDDGLCGHARRTSGGICVLCGEDVGPHDESPPEPGAPVPEPPAVPRDGWMFLAPSGARWLVVETQEGPTVVFTARTARHGHVVVVDEPGSGLRRVGQTFDVDEATKLAVATSLEIASGARAKTLIDPGARWRKQRVSSGAVDMVRSLHGDELADRCSRKGHTSDLITLGKWLSPVERTVREILERSATLDG